MRALGFLFALALLFVGCQRPLVQARSEPLAASYLASEKVDTPDPWRKCYVGQQIIIRWSLPRSQRPLLDDYTIVLTTRDAFGCEEKRCFKPPQLRGFWILDFVNDTYWEKGGIPTYKVELFLNEELIDMWKHHIWVERIVIGENA